MMETAAGGVARARVRARVLGRRVGRGGKGGKGGGAGGGGDEGARMGPGDERIVGHHRGGSSDDDVDGDEGLGLGFSRVEDGDGRDARTYVFISLDRHLQILDPLLGLTPLGP